MDAEFLRIIDEETTRMAEILDTSYSMSLLVQHERCENFIRYFERNHFAYAEYSRYEKEALEILIRRNIDVDMWSKSMREIEQ
jgi:hypothetical protein